MRDTPSGRSGEAVSLERGFDGARAENPKFDNSRPVRRREAPTNVEVSGLRGFLRRSARLPGWASGSPHAPLEVRQVLQGKGK